VQTVTPNVLPLFDALDEIRIAIPRPKSGQWIKMISKPTAAKLHRLAKDMEDYSHWFPAPPATTEGQGAGAVPHKSAEAKPQKRGGSKPRCQEADARLYEDYKQSGQTIIKDFARATGKEYRVVKLALDRHRHRQRRK
jgi:hypothetical protein